VSEVETSTLALEDGGIPLGSFEVAGIGVFGNAAKDEDMT
jgi:hypothetical protein